MEVVSCDTVVMPIGEAETYHAYNIFIYHKFSLEPQLYTLWMFRWYIIPTNCNGNDSQISMGNSVNNISAHIQNTMPYKVAM